MSQDREPLSNSVQSSIRLRDIVILQAWTSGYTKKWGQNLRKAIFTLLFIASNLTGSVTLPLLSATMDAVGSDNFVVIYHTAIISSFLLISVVIFVRTCLNRSIPLTLASSWKIVLANALANVFNYILVIFASPPSRTPPYLQSILSMTAIPFTVLLRLMFLRKGVSPGRGICCAIIIVGLFISSEPQIWGLNTQQTENNASSSLLQRILWPMCFALGFVPFAFVNLTCEKVLTTRNSEALNFILWSQLIQIPLLTGFFWTDFIPGFGMVDNFSDFRNHFQRGLQCSYSSASDCGRAVTRSWIFIAAFTCGTFSQYLLVQSSDGAIFASIVEAVVGPLASLFWTLYRYNKSDNSIHWHPVFNETTAFSLAGLGLMIPGIILYHYFVIHEEKSEEVNLDDLVNTI